MLCEKCNKNEATVFVQQFVNGEKKEFHLCPSCASINYSDISFENMFQGFLNNLAYSNNMETDNKSGYNKTLKKCKCGMTFKDIRNIGKLGCSECYDTFNEELNEIVRGIQGATVHLGKFPKKSGMEFALKRKIETLKLELNEKIAKEEYEEAAKIRDEIKTLEGGEGDE